MVIAAPVALLFVFNVRVEIDGEHIAKYRGSRLLVAPVRTIQEIGMTVGKKTLRFEGGEEFDLNNNWVNVAAAAAFFQAILDARASARLTGAAPAAAAGPLLPPAPPADAGGAVPWLAGGPRGDAAAALRDVSPALCPLRPPTDGHVPGEHLAEHRFAGAGFSRTATVSVPVCRRCERVRSAVGPLAFLLYFVTLVGGIVAAAVYVKPPAGRDFVGAILVVYLFSAAFLGRRAGGVLDRIFLGVRASRMSKDGQMITLRFRDAGLAATVAELTERRRAGRLSAAKRLLEEE